MNITIDGVPHNHTIRSLAKEAGVTPIVIIHRMRKLGINGVKPEGRILFPEEAYDAIKNWK